MAAITDDELEQLLDFVGYGTLEAKVWFIGMEEAGGGEENIRARLSFQQVEDCAEAHKKLGITKHHEGKKVIQPTWRGMCSIMLQLEGGQPDRETIRDYQVNHLGRIRGTSLLCELMPIPKPDIDSWEYEVLLPQYASRKDYYQKVKLRRIEYLKALMTQHQPAVVIAYGKNYWPDYRSLFPGNVGFKSVDGFMLGKTAGTTIVLCDHLTARSMNGRFRRLAELITKSE